MSQKITKNGVMLNGIIERQNFENLDIYGNRPTFISHDGEKKSLIDFVFQHKENKAKIHDFKVDHHNIFRIKSNSKKNDLCTLFHQKGY